MLSQARRPTSPLIAPIQRTVTLHEEKHQTRIMAKSLPSLVVPLVIFFNFFSLFSHVNAACSPGSYLPGTGHNCNTENDSECCKSGMPCPQYYSSPPVTGRTRARMTLNSFQKGGDGGGPSECDNRYHNDTARVVALSTGWYNRGSRCLKHINIYANGRTTTAKVVDECDSVHGQPPCDSNIVDASRAVWDALGIPESQIGDYQITWSDANF